MFKLTGNCETFQCSSRLLLHQGSKTQILLSWLCYDAEMECFSFFLFYFHHWISPCEVKQPTLFCRIPSYLNLKQITRKTKSENFPFYSLFFSADPACQPCQIKMSRSQQLDWLGGSWQNTPVIPRHKDKSCYGGAKTELVCPGRDASSQPASQPAS